MLDAANTRFREQGYDATTAAAIAKDAGVTERTFFRYFPTKADVLVANWQLHGDALRAVLATGDDRPLIDVVRDAIRAFTDRLTVDIDEDLDSVMRVYTDPAASVAIMQNMFTIEDDLAVEIGRRSGRDDSDFLVRLTANASLGVFRAAVRAGMVKGETRQMSALVEDGIRRLTNLFETFEPPVETYPDAVPDYLPEYVQGSDTRREIESRSMRSGQVVKRAPVYAPGAPVHAVRAGGTVAVCGHEVAYVSDYPWRNMSHDRCVTCQRLVPLR